MPKCTECNTTWRKRDVCNLLLSDNGSSCPGCGKTQYFSNNDSDTLIETARLDIVVGLAMASLLPTFVTLSSTNGSDD